ncbi:MAG: hypothetical protein CVU39_28475 [Chloroflexi bacterium HGW-Chloroflexi-10]|nr:MAG: hypothetical protein CVU39_28475 [Chloroflexi bacterium HGW-Chloroflexi-10]
MNTSQMIVAISIAILTIIAFFAFLKRKNRRENKFSPLAGFAFAFIVAGVIFVEVKLVGYGLLAMGVVLAAVDIFMRSRTN